MRHSTKKPLPSRVNNQSTQPTMPAQAYNLQQATSTQYKVNINDCLCGYKKVDVLPLYGSTATNVCLKARILLFTKNACSQCV